MFSLTILHNILLLKKVLCLRQKVFLLYLGGANVCYFLKEVSGCLCGHLHREPGDQKKKKKRPNVSFTPYTISSIHNALFWAIYFWAKSYYLSLTMILWLRDQHHLYYTTYRIDGFVGSKSETTVNYFNYKFSNSM